MSYRKQDAKGYQEACHRMYKRAGYAFTQHHTRFTANVTNRKPQLTCQDCHGEGGSNTYIGTDFPMWEDCGWCEGTGYVTPHLRGEWLRMMKAEKKAGHTHRC